MPFKPFVLGAVAAACVTAAAGGAYVAVRQTRVEPSAVADPATSPTGTTSSPAPVTETEGIVTPPSSAPSAAAEAPDLPPVPVPDRSPRKDAPVRQIPPPPASRSANARPTTTPASPPRRDAPLNDAGRRAESGATASASPGRDVASPAPVAELPPTPARAPEPAPAPEPRYVEVVVPASAVIGLQVDRSLSTETARVEDRLEARVTRDVMAEGQRAIPAGSRMMGSVVLVDRGGKMKDAARLGVRFHTLVLADGTELPLRTETIYRDGDSPGNESSRKVGGAAVGGAILGAILGGGKGAVLGGAAGAAGGTAAVMAGGRNAATLPAGTVITARVAGPVTVQVEKE
ncbi:MAG: hypothetical protein ABI211_00145 [Vicinamibacterales bacterium]